MDRPLTWSIPERRALKEGIGALEDSEGRLDPAVTVGRPVPVEWMARSMPRYIPVFTAALSSLIKSSGPVGGVRGIRGERAMGAGTEIVGATGAGGPTVSPISGINGIVAALVLVGTTIPEAPEGKESPVAGPLPAIASPKVACISTGVELGDAEAISPRL
uniref:Uncharacterized protein n=1 Tax=Amphimedon queenslandica TaxID=400682 RepID=A0A1X7US50_AMPQE